MAEAAPSATATASHLVDLSDVSDPTIISLWKRIYSFLPGIMRVDKWSRSSDNPIVTGMLVCKTFKEELPSLVKNIHITRYKPSDKASEGEESKRSAVSAVSPQKQLEHIATTFPNLEFLNISLEYSDYTPDLDFRKVNLPSLRSLFLHCAPIRSVEFTQANTPKLKSLNLDHCRSVIAFKLDLPELEQVSVDFMEVQDARGFGRSLSSCPKLTQFTAYKLWGLSGTVHKLDLPECGWLSLHRSDDLEGLNICAPKLESLELRGCYSLECVRILPDPEGTTPKPLQVNLINANIDRVSKQHLKTHPRVKAPGGKFITKESQDEFASMFFESGMTASEDEESDDENDGPMIGMEGFLQMMHMMGQHAQMDPQIAAMMMQGGPFGPLGGMFAHDEADDYHDDGNEDEYETDSEGGAIDHDPDHDNPDHDTPDHDDPDHDDPDHDDADHDDSDQQDHDGPGFPGGMGPIPGVPAGFSAMLAMAMMNGMPVGMAMDGLHMMAAGYGDDSGSLSDGEEGDDDDEYVSGEGEGDGEPNGGPSCVVEEVE